MNANLKGPWRIAERETLEDGSVYPRHVVTEVGEYQICLLESLNMAALGYDRTPAEQERDRLIATAPELLAAVLLLKEQNRALREALQEAIDLGVDKAPVRKWSLVLADSLNGWQERDAAIAKAARSAA